MADETATDSPLEAAAGAAGPRATEAFATLGNETRLSILLALWEAYEPFAEDNAVPFSDLRDRIGLPQGAQFTYHLNQLVGHFVRKTDDGYELRRAGHQLVGTVIAGTGIEEPTLEPTEVDTGTNALASATGSYAFCPRCGAPTAVTYQDGTLYLLCTECEGNWGRSETAPSGVITAGDFAPAGLIDRTPEQAWNAFMIESRHALQSAEEGVCDVCSGPMDTSLHICEEHTSDGLCDNCGRTSVVTARRRCLVCKNNHRGNPYWIVAMHPDVIGFFNERGVSLQYASDAVHPPEDAEQELVSDDPPRVRITYQYEGDRLEVLVDEEMNVLEVTEPD